MTHLSPLALVAALLLSATAHSADATSVFLKQHCFRCHGSKRQKSGRRFDTLPEKITSFETLERYQEMVDQLNLQEMPPEDEEQPTAQERARAIERLTAEIARARETLTGNGGRSVLRRLNAWEYRHTIGDLLDLNVDAWNPAENFPAEATRAGFDNNGDALVTSGILLEHYLTAAEEAIRRATYFEPRPDSQRLSQKSPFYFRGKDSKDLPKLFRLDRFRFTPDTPYTDLYGRHYRGGHIGFLPTARGGLKHSGQYTIRVRAAAVDRRHHYGNAIGDFRNGDPLVLEIAAVDRKGSVESTGNVSKFVSLSKTELTSTEPRWIEWTGFIEKGYEPEVRFRNGPLAAKRLVRWLTTKAAHHEEIKPFAGMKGGTAKAHGVLKAYRGPKLRVWEIQVEGPKTSSWPPAGHRRLYGDLRPEELNRESIAQRLEAFAEDAFRRPPVAREIEPLLQLVTDKIEEGVKPLEALQLGFQAILCAPGFLYLNAGDGALDHYAIASRIAAFLWSSRPDETLIQLASKKKLHDPKTLREQVDRMLRDRKSDRFVKHFVRRWLDVDNLGEMPPSKEFVSYYRDGLESAMRAETETFFRHLLDANRPPSEFLEADYSFLNRELAAHYGLEGIEGSELRRVSLKGTNRGGLLGQALFLTASANGVDTSPVVRGIFVLEKILGYTPPPPPPDVPAVEPDARGAKTIREQLAKHRELTTCAECHRKIDPLGFALENFDAIGAWRDHYDKKQTIDASGQFPGGDSFANVPEFREQVIERKSQFLRCLTEKLLSYAIGREVGIAERQSV
ncbi:MAG: DUF1592 domain-containing protein, partial [Planctomycetota bacterium]